MKVSKSTIARTVILIIALVNNALALMGKSPLPIDDETVNEVISFGFTVITALVAWWKNNSFTRHALEADATFKGIKGLEQERNDNNDEDVE